MITNAQKAYFILAHTAITGGLTQKFWQNLGRFSLELGIGLDEFVIISSMEMKQVERVLSAMLGSFFNPRCKNEHREVQFLPEIHSSVCAYCGYMFEAELKMGDIEASEHEFRDIEASEYEFPNEELED